jgi:hypothetical protein
MAILGQFRLRGGNFVQGAASFCNYAGQMRYKHPWCAKSNAPAILLLPSFERCFFYVDRGAHLRNAVSQAPMETLAVGREFSLGMAVLPPSRLIALALLPVQAPLFYAALFIIIIGIIGSALPFHLALQAAFFLGIGAQLLTERDQVGSSLAWHNRQC